MAIRISGITLPDNKRIEIALTAVYGIGRPLITTVRNLVVKSACKFVDEVLEYYPALFNL